jgi:hypothetical protein
MPAPAKPFTVIADSKIDADSPVTEELMTFIRDNIEHLEEWLGKSFVAATDHNHDGVNSALTSIGASIKWFNVPIVKFTGNPTNIYTSIDITADVDTISAADTAKAAIIGVSITGTGVVANAAAINFRQNGTTGPHAVVEAPNAAVATMKANIICPVDAGEIFQYQEVSNGISTATIALVGYII